jgi:hypothetical protein
MKREVADSLGLLLYVVGVSLIIVPFANVALTVYPWRPADPGWRFGTWGFLLGAMTLPMLGFGMIGAGGVLKESRAVLRFGAVVATVLAVVVSGALIDFLLSGTSLKAAATVPDMVTMYRLEMRKTAVISALTIPAFAAMAIAQYRILKGVIAGTEGPQSILHVGKS